MKIYSLLFLVNFLFNGINFNDSIPVNVHFTQTVEVGDRVDYQNIKIVPFETDIPDISLPTKERIVKKAETKQDEKTGLLYLSLEMKEASDIIIYIGDGEGTSFFFEHPCKANAGNNNIVFGPTYLPRGEYVCRVSCKGISSWVNFSVE